MKPFTKTLLIVLFPLTLLMPAASILLPIEPSEIDNQRLVSPEVSPQSLLEPGFYKDALGYIKNANPVRALLIQLGTGVDYHLLGESPNPNEVLRGAEGWLFRRSLLNSFCDPTIAEAPSRLVKFVQAIESEGASVVLTVLPPKFVIYPEFLTEDQRLLAACGRQGSETLRDELGSYDLDGYVDSWDVFEAAKTSGVLTYFRTDTHFNYLGSAPWIESIVSEIEPGMWEVDALRDLGTVEFEGNLARQIVPGLTETVQKVVIDRDVSTEPVERRHQPISPSRAAIERFRVDHQELPLIARRTLVLGDSYMNLPLPSLVQYFADITFTDWRSEESLDYFLREAHRAEIVIIEITGDAVAVEFADDTHLEAFRSRG